MYIDEKRRLAKPNTVGGNKGKSKTSPVSGRNFPVILAQYQSEGGDDNLEDLLKSLDEMGDRLANSFSLSDLKNYRDVLRDFLQRTQGKAYRIKEQVSIARRGKTKVLQIIEKINSQLEELSDLVMAGQKDQVKILARLDQIRGLLVDLYS